MLFLLREPNQNAKNLIKLSDYMLQSVDYSGTPARHTVDVTLAAGFDGVKFKDFEGNDRTASLGASVISDPDELELAILTAAEVAWRDGGMGARPVLEFGDNTGVRVRDLDGTNKRITIDADFEVVALLNGSTETALTRLTEPVIATELTITHDVGAQGNLSYDGNDEALGSHATTEGAALATAIGTALGNLSVEYGSITVVESDDNTEFTINIEVLQKPIFYDGTQMSRVGSLRMFKTGSGGGLAGQLTDDDLAGKSVEELKAIVEAAESTVDKVAEELENREE